MVELEPRMSSFENLRCREVRSLRVESKELLLYG